MFNCYVVSSHTVKFDIVKREDCVLKSLKSHYDFEFCVFFACAGECHDLFLNVINILDKIALELCTSVRTLCGREP